jgi:hypothetical protein
VGEQTWRGFPLVKVVQLPDEEARWYSDPWRSHGKQNVLLAGLRRFRQLAWEHDADAWYAAEVARMRERAPA